MFACEESCKAPCENTSEPPFRKRIFGKRFFFFSLLKIVYWDVVKAFFKRKAPKANANFCVFESQCPKIMVLSKALKAKLSSIPSGVASLSMPSLDWLSGKTTTIVPRFDHQLWWQLPHTRGLVRGPFSNSMWCVCRSREASGALSLSLEEVGLPFALW